MGQGEGSSLRRTSVSRAIDLLEVMHRDLATHPDAGKNLLARGQVTLDGRVLGRHETLFRAEDLRGRMLNAGGREARLLMEGGRPIDQAPVETIRAECAEQLELA